MKKLTFLLLIIASALFSRANDFTYGADVSWMTFQEDRGIQFFHADETTPATVEDLLQEYGFNGARLRVWVNPERYANDSQWPTAGYCDRDDAIRKARRLAAKGQDIMLCFHLSDIWCDPSKQRIPQAWADAATDIDALTALVVAHIRDICSALADEGISARWVQIGNEDNTGFMTQNPSGGALNGCLTGVSSESAAGYIKVFNAAAAAAREIFPQTSIVHHLANGQNWSKINWNLSKVCPTDGSVANNTRLDVDYIGLSLYPLNGSANTTAWRPFADDCLQSMLNINSVYGLRSLVVEVGMNNDYSSATTSGTSQNAHTEQCNADVSAFAEHFIAAARRSGVCDGVFYWEPQSSYTDYGSPTGVTGQGGYTLGAMMDLERKSMSWGSRTKLAPNAYWDMIRRLASGYEPEPEPEPELADWNFKFSVDDKVSWQVLPFSFDESLNLFTLSGISDDAATWCLNYYIVNKDLSQSLIASQGVSRDIEYPLFSTLSGDYEGWSGWFQDKWLSPSDVITFDPQRMVLKVVASTGAIDAPEIDSNEPALYFNLQGIPVANPAPGQLLIVRRGNNVSKIRF